MASNYVVDAGQLVETDQARQLVSAVDRRARAICGKRSPHCTGYGKTSHGFYQPRSDLPDTPRLAGRLAHPFSIFPRDAGYLLHGTPVQLATAGKG